MEVLVTGGAGFIGSNLVHYLTREQPDWHITVLDLLTYAGNLENIVELVRASRISFVKADIVDPVAVGEVFKGRRFDYVFHLAAESHVDRSIHSASEFVRTNVLGTQQLLNAFLAQQAGRFVHISTDEVYGSLGPTGKFFETTPLDPTSPYAASKAASDLLVLAAGKTHAANIVVTRCTNNYGPYQFPEKFIPLFVTNALADKKVPLYGDGLNVRSWLHVEDHCRALLSVALHGRAGQIYNIGADEEGEITNADMTKRILTLLGKPQNLIEFVKDRKAHDRRYAVDTKKIRSELGWAPQVSLSQGLAATVQWYREHQEWWQHIKSGTYKDFYLKHYGREHAAKVLG